MIAIFFILCFFLIKDFKKTFIIYTPFKFLFTSGIVLYGGISFDNAISLVIVFLFFLHGKKFLKHIDNKPQWPLMFSFILLIISESISALLDDYNVISIPLKICRNYAFAFILYYIIQTKDDFKLLIKSLMVYICLLMINCFAELCGHNFIGEILQSNMMKTAFFVDTIDYGTRGLRLHSFLPHAICFGNVCAIFIAVLFFLYSENYQKKKCFYCIILLIIGIVLSNSRTPVVALFLYIIPVLYKYMKFKMKVALFILALTIIYVFSEKILQTLDGMFVVGSEYATGSSMTMRLEQLEATLDIAKNTLWFGLGFNYNLDDYVSELRGAESVWFNLLIYGGIFSVISEVLMFLQSIFNTTKFKSYNNILWISIGYFFQQSSTYNSGLNDFLFYFSIIIIMSYDFLYNSRMKLNYHPQNVKILK